MALKAIASDIKLSHSIFALPFAIAGLLIAEVTMPTTSQILLLLVCMVCARTFAMCINRIADREIDLGNPRTRSRALPSKRVKILPYRICAAISAWCFAVAAFILNPVAGYLSLPLILILACYSYMKRLTVFTHWYLGACLGLAPLAAVIALDGTVSLSLILLCLSITFWTAGFDIIYALQDLHFDRDNQIKSIPAKLGVKKSILISKICFLFMTMALLTIGYLQNKGFIYYMGVFIIGVFLSYEHRLIRSFEFEDNGKKINKAFFTMNAYVSVVYLIFLQFDIWVNK